MMIRAPKWTEVWKYPVIAGVATLAVGITLAWWAKVDISPLFATAEIRRGQLWRLVTCIFPHLDILHLTFDVYWLWMFGTTVEKVYGHARTGLLIFLFAVGSSSLDFAFDSGGVGLSGVGYGLFGLLFVLSDRDERFRDALDQRTVKLFVGWFLFCIFTTVTHVFRVANVAHGAGAILGVLIGYSISVPNRRVLGVTAVTAVVCFGIWGATLGRPILNLSGRAGYDEGKWGYDDLIAGKNEQAIRWLNDAARLQPKESAYWFNLGIAYQRVGQMPAAIAGYKRAFELSPDNTEYSKALQTAN
jgi:membrane associated rhomboid family serine protease